MPQTLTKQPGETRIFTMDCSPRLAADDSIGSITSITERTVADDGTRTSSNDLTIGSGSVSGQNIQVSIAGGDHGTTYEITFLFVLGTGEIVEAEGYLYVSDT